MTTALSLTRPFVPRLPLANLQETSSSKAVPASTKFPSLPIKTSPEPGTSFEKSATVAKNTFRQVMPDTPFEPLVDPKMGLIVSMTDLSKQIVVAARGYKVTKETGTILKNIGIGAYTCSRLRTIASFPIVDGMAGDINRLEIVIYAPKDRDYSSIERIAKVYKDWEIITEIQCYIMPAEGSFSAMSIDPEGKVSTIKTLTFPPIKS